MNLNSRIQAFKALGTFLTNYIATDRSESPIEGNFHQKMDNGITAALQHNRWFTKEDIFFALKSWSKNLTENKLNHWIKRYDFSEARPKTVAIIMAGNVPLVGFHDFLSVLISGHKALVKQSSKDHHLLPCLADFLIQQNTAFKERIEFTDEKLTDFDAVIATGSNNTARYFEYYFSHKPHIIRRNRNSAAILRGNEPKEQLEKLGEDIFRYFGLGCRNVSKLFVPKGYDFDSFFKAIYPWNPIIHHHKYANNYDYNKAVYLMSEFKILDNGFLVLKEENEYASPIACLFYEYYEDEEKLKQRLSTTKNQIQCIVGSDEGNGELAFGSTQHPELHDYADGVDSLAFLKKL